MVCSPTLGRVGASARRRVGASAHRRIGASAHRRIAHTLPLPCSPALVNLAEVRVIATPAELARIPGSATLVTPAALNPWRTTTINDVLRRVPGVTVREEEGLGLRPNIGLRGLNPTRSTKVLLLEDGIPVTFAPYGDNAAYYHPPVTRFEDRGGARRGADRLRPADDRGA
jgi:outer membrane receptor for Fe3+-dicitrate